MTCWTRQLHVVKLLSGQPGLHHVTTYILRTGLRHSEPTLPEIGSRIQK